MLPRRLPREEQPSARRPGMHVTCETQSVKQTTRSSSSSSSTHGARRGLEQGWQAVVRALRSAQEKGAEVRKLRGQMQYNAGQRRRATTAEMTNPLVQQEICENSRL